MRKLTLISILAISMLSLAGCSSASSLSSKSDTEISDTSEISNETKSEIVDKEEIEETSSEAEEPQLEPVIALSYEDYEFDISNMTYKDLLAFFQAIGYPASSDGRNMELEPYERRYFSEGPGILITVGDDDIRLDTSVYNTTGEKISVLDARVCGIDGLRDFSDNKLKILGIVNADIFTKYNGQYQLREDLESQLSEFGYIRNDDEFIKRLDDGREVRLDTVGLDITPVYDYGTY